ncbi:MAG: hypothetical protein PVH41_15410 [Anaerolineae bacterium]|jgi:hypothetical protein
MVPGRPTKLLSIILTTLLLVLTSCTIETNRSAKASTDWSRGLRLGQTRIKQPAALQVDDAGQVHLVWCNITADSEDRLRYVRLNQQGQVVVDQAIPTDLPDPRKPQLLIGGDGALNLGWLSRTEGRQTLFHARLDDHGHPAAAVPVSGHVETVDRYHMVHTADGTTAFVWSSRPATEGGQHGVYYRRLTDPSPTLLVPDGIEPFLLVDASRTTHLTWLVEQGALAVRDVYYATLDGARISPPGGVKLADFRYSEAGTYHGPVLGADDDQIYVIWAVQRMGGGFTPGAARTDFVSFKPGGPSLANPKSIAIPADTAPRYTEHAGAFGYTELAATPLQGPGSDFVNAPSTVRGQESELPVALSLVVQSSARDLQSPEAWQLTFEDSVALTSSGTQLAMAVMSGGRPIGYQLISNTPGASVLSTLVADALSDLHVAWIDTAGFRQYDVYYATTSAEARAWLDRTTVRDVALTVAGLAWGVLSGVGLIPLVAVWNLGPVMWIVIFYVFSRREHTEDLVAWLGLLVAAAIYTASKLLFLPGLSTGAPLFRLPAQTSSLLAAARPIVILALALALTYRFTRRSHEPTVFKAYLTFALTDGVLTILLYAPQFLRTP